ncbi:unknown protein (plasmid) [Nostoc sp. NIES-3756]|uniref:hypothetical protein n=1 Tax=Nostoc sp. NIES-3756 TaxID=1751286 RepID=UPI0007228A6A|nr:hypothetical protein [Nostoc sp. NIES-3756]BAT56951.1 unknown protein [Nostoc sp. NIES-3756]
MQATLIIPKHWEYPNFTFGQRTQQGIIIGLEYHPADCQIAFQSGYGWRYALVQNKRAIEVQHYSDDQLQALSAEEIKAQLQAEIELHQLQVLMLQEQLTMIKRGGNHE